MTAGRRDCIREPARLANDPHPAPAAPGGRLDHQREADLLRFAARQDGDAGSLGRALRLELVAAAAQGVVGGTNEDEPPSLDGFGEVGVLGKESVARVDRVRAGLPRGANVFLGVEVVVDLDDLVRSARMQRALVVGSDNRHRRNRFGRAGAEDPDCDLAAVGYEELPDLHAAGRLSRNARRPSWPSGLVRSLAASCAASSPPGVHL